MHQHPRSPAPSAPSVPSRPRSSRAQDVPSSPTSDMKLSDSRGLGINSPSDSSEQPSAPAKEVMTKLNQIILVRSLSLSLCAFAFLFIHRKEWRANGRWLYRIIIPKLP